jgi:hypothetical protein
MKDRRPDLSEFQINRGRATQFKDKDGAIQILIKNEGFPDKFLPYLETHERWEAYVAHKKGFNLVDLARKEACKALRIPYPRMSDNNVDRLFSEFVNEYRFDFKHEFAIWKEYSQAEADGRLNEYHAFVMSLREADQKTFGDNPSVSRQTRNDVAIRESILKKITTRNEKTKGKHHFIKRLSA